MRDSQRGKVYSWEKKVIAPTGNGSKISIDIARGMVNAIWREMGLRHPPIVDHLPKQSRFQGSANRACISLQEYVESWVVLHEIAHSMTSTHDHLSAHHGPIFVGVYIILLEKYLRLDRCFLLDSLQQNGIRIDENARPVFLD